MSKLCGPTFQKIETTHLIIGAKRNSCIAPQGVVGVRNRIADVFITPWNETHGQPLGLGDESVLSPDELVIICSFSQSEVEAFFLTGVGELKPYCRRKEFTGVDCRIPELDSS
jgi:hypothetical protein